MGSPIDSSTRRTGLGARLTALAAVVAATAAFYVLRLCDASLPAAGPVLNGEDLNAYFVPTASFLRSAIHDGELPLWNPFQFAGTPFLATHAPGAAYPPMVLLSLLPPHVALTLDVLLHLILVGAFTFAFAAAAGLATAGALSAAFLYMFSYSTMFGVHNTAYLSTYAWLPAVLWGVQAVVNAPGPGRAAGLALAVAMCLLSGFSQGSLYTLEVAAVFGLVLLLRTGASRQTATTLGWLACGAVLGAAAAAVQLLPALELARLGVRSIHGMSLDNADPLDWRFVHGSDIGNLLLGRGSRILHPPLLLSGAILASVVPRGRRVLGAFFLLLLIGAADFARGRDGWLFPISFQLPLGNIFRLPARSVFLVDFAMAALVGVAVSNVLAPLASRKGFRILAVGVVLAFGTEAFVGNPLRYRFDPITQPEQMQEPANLVKFAKEAAQSRQRFFLQRTIVGLAPRNFGMIHDVYVVPGYDPMLPNFYKQFFGIPADAIWHGDLDIVSVGRFTRPWGIQDPRLLDLLGVQFYVDAMAPMDRRVQNPGMTARVGNPPLDFTPPLVYPRSGALPHTYVVHDVVEARDDDDALSRVRGFSFDPRSQVVIAGQGLPQPEAPVAGARESAGIRTYRRNTVEIDAECASACVLVLTDLWYPGWKADVDGRETDILRANFLLRAVAVPAGAHRVRFVYDPASFRAGLAVTSLALAGISALLAGSSRASRRRRREAANSSV